MLLRSKFRFVGIPFTGTSLVQTIVSNRRSPTEVELSNQFWRVRFRGPNLSCLADFLSGEIRLGKHLEGIATLRLWSVLNTLFELRETSQAVVYARFEVSASSRMLGLHCWHLLFLIVANIHHAHAAKSSRLDIGQNLQSLLRNVNGYAIVLALILG